MRPPHLDDGPAVVQMLNDEARALVGVGFTGLDWVTAPWSAPGVDLERDFAVVHDDDGHLAGYFFLEYEPDQAQVFSIGGVALVHHGRGLGSAIVSEIERRALAQVPAGGPPANWRMGALADEPRVDALLSAHGFVETRRFWSMRIAFDGPPQPAAPISGITLRALAAGEEAAVHDCMVDAFRDHWGEAIEPLDRWLHHHVHAAERFQPQLWQVALDGDRMVGALVASPVADEDPEMGYIDLVGVRRDSRGRGIGEALLRRGLCGLHQQGRAGALLIVDSESITGATRLYQRVGMTARPRFANWDRPLRPPAA
jgi:mycothiol synthase